MVFTPALIVVDLQEDFCPPSGSLAVEGGREVAAPINTLLSLPFAIRVGTKDWHPFTHTSFAQNHSGDKKAFESVIGISNPFESTETHDVRLWPPHCVQDTKGAELIPELDASKLDVFVQKGMHESMEMYSAFGSPYKHLPSPVTQAGVSHDLEGVLKEKGVTDVYVTGLAADYCVFWTARDAANLGFNVFVVEEATRAVDKSGMDSVRETWGREGVKVVRMHGEEVSRVRD